MDFSEFNFKIKCFIFLLVFSLGFFVYSYPVFAWDIISEQLDYSVDTGSSAFASSSLDVSVNTEVLSIWNKIDLTNWVDYPSPYVGSVNIFSGTEVNDCGDYDYQQSAGYIFSSATSTGGIQDVFGHLTQYNPILPGHTCMVVRTAGQFGSTFLGSADDKPYYIAYADIVDGEDPGDTSTRLISVTPEHLVTISSSSVATIGIEAYVNEFDVGNTRWDIDVTPYYERGLASAWYNFASYFPAYSYEIMATTSGVFSFSTTTKEALPENTYYLDVSLHTECEDYPIFGYSCFDVDEREKVSSSTTFYSGKQDEEEKVFSEIPDLFEGAISTTSEALMDSCKISNFDLGLCAYALFIPDSKIMALDFQNFKDVLFTRFPWGYVTRFVDLAYSSNVEPPALVYDFGSSSPAFLQGKGIDIQIYDEFGVLSSIESDQGGGNLWDVVMPFFEVVIWLSVFFVILLDLLSLNWIFGSSSGGSTSTDEPSEFVSSGGSVETKKGRSINRSIPKDK